MGFIHTPVQAPNATCSAVFWPKAGLIAPHTSQTNVPPARVHATQITGLEHGKNTSSSRFSEKSVHLPHEGLVRP